MLTSDKSYSDTILKQNVLYLYIVNK